MKKTLVAALLGLATVTPTVFGQGAIVFSNYINPNSAYNQVVWDASIPVVGGTAITDPSVTFQLWGAKGVLSSLGSLTLLGTAHIDAGTTFNPGAGYGGGGYINGPTISLSDWIAGDTYTFALVVTSPSNATVKNGPLFWQESTAIHSAANPATGFQNMPVTIVAVPEPSTFALAGLGSAALLIFRRRK